MKILIPYHYYSTDLNLALTGEADGYEIRKSFSPDLREYSKISASANTDFNYGSVTNSYKSALLYLTNTVHSVAGNTVNFYKSLSANYSSAVALTAESFYGVTGSATGITKSLKIFPAEATTNYKYFRMDITGTTTGTHNVYNVCHGYIFELPETFRLVDQSFSCNYPLSKVGINLVGKIFYDGWQNNGIKSEHLLEFEWLNETDKDMLITMFQLGKGGLPVWFIESESNTDTWKLISMKSLSISEPYVKYFKASIQLREI